jgi:hypothetical protein
LNRGGGRGERDCSDKPDGTLSPLHVIMATIVARDGTIYATTIYPFTLLRIPAVR